jgi:hypothetical protein
MWTSEGHIADRMFGLFRTDNSGRKQEGITFLVLDLKSPGVDIRPILLFEGTHEVNQVFFDEPKMKPTPPATLQFSEPTLTPPSATAGSATNCGAAKTAASAVAAKIRLSMENSLGLVLSDCHDDKRDIA